MVCRVRSTTFWRVKLQVQFPWDVLKPADRRWVTGLHRYRYNPIACIVQVQFPWDVSKPADRRWVTRLQVQLPDQDKKHFLINLKLHMENHLELVVTVIHI